MKSSRSAAAAAVQLENAADDEDLSQLPAAWKGLTQEMDRLLGAVAKLCHQ